MGEALAPQFAHLDPEVGPQLDDVRIKLEPERSPKAVVDFVRAKIMEEGGMTDRARAQLELAMDDPEVRAALMIEHLSREERIMHGQWIDAEQYIRHPEAEILATWVIERYRPELTPYRIAVIMQEKMPPKLRRAVLGTATKLPGRMRFISDCDGVVTLDFFQWLRLTAADRQRLVHHELEHLTVLDGDEGPVLALRGHDFEEFMSIVETYGLRTESGMFSMDNPVAEVLEDAVSSQTRLGLG